MFLLPFLTWSTTLHLSLAIKLLVIIIDIIWTNCIQDCHSFCPSKFLTCLDSTFTIFQTFLWLQKVVTFGSFNPIALRKAKIVYNFGLSECNRVKVLKVSHTFSEICHTFQFSNILTFKSVPKFPDQSKIP